MAGIFQGDILIKTAIELGLEDMRKNPWLIDHMLDDLISIPYVADKYGQKQIDACKEWFKNNQVDIYMRRRKDKDRLPCITIEIGNSPEKEDMKHMADQSTCSVILLPEKIGKPIGYVVKPVDNFTYDQSSGLISFDTPPKGIDTVSVGQIVVNPATGEGYPIVNIDEEGIYIEAGLDIDPAQVAVVPMNRFYAARIEHTFFQETYNIGCHSHGDPQVMLWLWSIVKYSILRYRESLLEANGFTQSSVTSASPELNDAWTTPGGEEAWSRYITIMGQVENSWIKSPRRYIENVGLRERNGDKYNGGIKILSNSQPDDEDDLEDKVWYPIEDVPESDE